MALLNPSNAALATTQPAQLEILNEFPEYVGPTVGSIVGITAAVGGAVLDDWLEDKVKFGPLTPSGMAGIGFGVLGLWVENPDVSALCSYSSLGLSAPHAYDATRGALRRAREELK